MVRSESRSGPPGAWVSPTELAERAGVTPAAVHDQIRRGNLPAQKVPHGTRWRYHITAEDAAVFLAARGIGEPASHPAPPTTPASVASQLADLRAQLAAESQARQALETERDRLRGEVAALQETVRNFQRLLAEAALAAQPLVLPRTLND
jgi:hypothetical protein